jgi:hypothetical protein
VIPGKSNCAQYVASDMKPSGDRTVVGFRYGSMMNDALLAISG